MADPTTPNPNASSSYASQVRIDTSNVSIPGLEKKLGGLFDKYIKSAEATTKELNKLIKTAVADRKTVFTEKGKAFTEEMENRNDSAKGLLEYSRQLRKTAELQKKGVVVSNKWLINLSEAAKAVGQTLPSGVSLAAADMEKLAATAEDAAAAEIKHAQTIRKTTMDIRAMGSIIGGIQSFSDRFFSWGTAGTLALSSFQKSVEDATNALENQIPTLNYIPLIGQSLRRSVEGMGLTTAEFNKAMAGNTQAVYANKGAATDAREALGDWVETIGSSSHDVARRMTGSFETAAQVMTSLTGGLAAQGAKIPFKQMASIIGSPADPSSMLGSIKTLSMITNEHAEAIAEATKNLMNEQVIRNEILTMDKQQRVVRMRQLIAEQKMFTAMGKSLDEAREIQRTSAEMARKPLQRLEQAAKVSAIAGGVGMGGEAKQLFDLLNKQTRTAEETSQLTKLATQFTGKIGKMYGNQQQQWTAAAFQEALEQAGVWRRLEQLSGAGYEGKTLDDAALATISQTEILTNIQSASMEGNLVLKQLSSIIDSSGIRLAGATIAAIGASSGGLSSMLGGLGGGAGKLGKVLGFAGKFAAFLGPIGIGVSLLTSILPMFMSDSKKETEERKKIITEEGKTSEIIRDAGGNYVVAGKDMVTAAGSMGQAAKDMATVTKAEKAAIEVEEAKKRERIQDILEDRLTERSVDESWYQKLGGSYASEHSNEAIMKRAEAFSSKSSADTAMMAEMEAIKKKWSTGNASWFERTMSSEVEQLEEVKAKYEKYKENQTAALSELVGVGAGALVREKYGGGTKDVNLGYAKLREAIESPSASPEEKMRLINEQRAQVQKQKEALEADANTKKSAIGESQWKESMAAVNTQTEVLNKLEAVLKNILGESKEANDTAKDNKAAAEAAGRAAALENSCLRVSVTR